MSVQPSSKTSQEQSGGQLHNMSAPPTTTIAFVPYGVSPQPTAGQKPSSGQGLRRIARADPDALIRRHLPATYERLCQRSNGDAAAIDAAGRMKALLALTSALVAGSVAEDPDESGDEPLEQLCDRLADLAGRLPPLPPEFPAMAVAEPAKGETPGLEEATGLLAALWILAHLNGRTFNRDGPPILAAGLAEGKAYDLFAI